jgi:hypothetical protein
MKLINQLPKIIAISMALLFLYASFSKLLELNKFYHQLGKSPLIPYGYNEIVGNTVLIIEFLIVFLVYKNKIKISLLISFTLMFFFSLYIGYLLYFSYYVPCSCGGILGDLSWNAHMYFNIILTLITAIAYLFHNEK